MRGRIGRSARSRFLRGEAPIRRGRRANGKARDLDLYTGTDKNYGMRFARRARPRRGVAPIIGTILLVAITVVAASVLYLFRPALPSSQLTINWYASSGGSEPTWGDGTDCKNVGGVQQCVTLPAIDINFPNPTPVSLNDIQMVFLCNGTVYLSATLADIVWVPGSTGTVGMSGPQLQKCGAGFVPPRASWNRFAFYEQVTPGATVMQPGDILVVYAHTFTKFVDDDFHGAPLWCYAYQGACLIELLYTVGVPSIAAEIPLYGLYN